MMTEPSFLPQPWNHWSPAVTGNDGILSSLLPTTACDRKFCNALKSKALVRRMVLPTVHLLELVGGCPFAGGLFESNFPHVAGKAICPYRQPTRTVLDQTDFCNS